MRADRRYDRLMMTFTHARARARFRRAKAKKEHIVRDAQAEPISPAGDTNTKETRERDERREVGTGKRRRLRVRSRRLICAIMIFSLAARFLMRCLSLKATAFPPMTRLVHTHDGRRD